MSINKIPDFKKYEAHDVNIPQSLILELISMITAPVSGEQLVRILLENRLLWFAVFPTSVSHAVAPMEIANGRYFCDGLVLYTDMISYKQLVDLFTDVAGVEYVSFVNMSKIDDDGLDVVDYPPESTVFVNISWDTPVEMEKRFVESVI